MKVIVLARSWYGRKTFPVITLTRYDGVAREGDELIMSALQFY